MSLRPVNAPSQSSLMPHVLGVCCTHRDGRRSRLLCRYFPTILIVLLAVFNDGAMIALSKDRVVASPVPNHWDLRSIFIVGEGLAWLIAEQRVRHLPSTLMETVTAL